MTPRILPFVALLCAAALVGCSGNVSAPRTVPVTGTVLYHGKPVADVRVTFHPKFSLGSGKAKFEPSGMTDKQGKFVISTAAPYDGAPPGEYVVTFVATVTESDRKTGIEVEVDRWKGKYADPAASKVTVKISKGMPDLEPFRLD